MNYGAFLGFFLSLLAMLFWFFGIDDQQSFIPSIINNLSIIGFLVYSICLYRDNISDGYISYSISLKLGTSVAFFSSIIMALYTFIYVTYLSPDIIDNIIVMTEQALLQSNPEISETELDLAIEMTAKLTQPHWLMTMGVLSGTFMGFLYSAIISFFTKNIPSNKIV
jgi:hypothetical protein